MFKFSSAALAAAVVGGLMVMPASAQTKINIGYGFTSDTLSVHIAKTEGIFAKHGLDATLTPISGASAMMAGLFSGSLQFIMSNQAQMLTGVNGGLDLIVVAGGARTTKENDPIGLVAAKGFDYSKPSDLIGKKVAVGGFDSGTYLVLRKWLEIKGVDASKIDFVEGSMPTMGDLLKAGRVDAVTTVEPFLSKMISDGFGKLAEKYYTQVIGDQPAIFWVSSGDWIGKNRAAVLAFRASLKEAAAFIQANPKRAKEVEFEVFKANKATLPNSNDLVTPADLEAYYQIGKALKVYDKPIDTAKLIFKE